MTAPILQIPNEPHLAVIREAMRRVGRCPVFERHPFAGLPFWKKQPVVDLRGHKGRAGR